MSNDWIALQTDLPPEPLRLARRIWDRPRAALLWSADGSGHSYLMCEPVESATGLDPEPTLALGQNHERGVWATVPRWVGILPYESERARMERELWRPVEHRPQPHIETAQWQRFDAVCVIGSRVFVVGERTAALRLNGRLRQPHPAELSANVLAPEGKCLLRRKTNDDGAEHLARIERALALIRAGDIYQINLARRLEFDVIGSSLDLLDQMVARSKPPYAAAVELGDQMRLLSTSPELFLRTFADGRVETIPIKGTRPRGTDARSDRKLARELEADEKERAELAMVVDIERNDLGRIAVTGSVRAEPPRVVMHQHVFHRQSLVHARLKADVDRTAVLQACLPSGSITGAPKVRAMEVIASLENARRGAYTGAHGFVAHDGSLHLAMAIRCLTVKGRDGHYSVGGGIVADSVPELELRETEWKAVQVTRQDR